MWIRSKGEDTIVVCKVHPNASTDLIEGIKEDHLSVRLSSPPIEGKANKSLIKFFSKSLRLAQSKITIIKGEKSRTKVITIKGMEPVDVIAALGL